MVELKFPQSQSSLKPIVFIVLQATSEKGTLAPLHKVSGNPCLEKELSMLAVDLTNQKAPWFPLIRRNASELSDVYNALL